MSTFETFRAHSAVKLVCQPIFFVLLPVLRMCDLSVLEKYSSPPPAGESGPGHAFEEYAVRTIIRMFPVFMWLVLKAHERVGRNWTESMFSAYQVQLVGLHARRHRRESSRVLQLVVWGSPSTGYWTTLSFGSNSRQVIV